MADFLSDLFSPHSILSGGITSINDNILNAFGAGKNNTFGALNDALKHGPLETSIEKGRPASYKELETDRAQRLDQDPSKVARPIADIAGLIGLAYGGAALGGTSAGGGASTGTATTGEGAAMAGNGLSAGSGTSGLTSGGGVGLKAGSTIGTQASTDTAASGIAPSMSSGSASTAARSGSISDYLSSMPSSNGSGGRQHKRTTAAPMDELVNKYNQNNYQGADGYTIKITNGAAQLIDKDGNVVSTIPADQPGLTEVLHSAVNKGA